MKTAKFGVAIGVLISITILSCLNSPFRAQESSPIQLTSTSARPKKSEVYSVVWSPDGTRIAISGGGSPCNPNDPSKFAIRIFDATTGQIQQTLTAHTCPTDSVSWSYDGTHLISVSNIEVQVYVWDITTGEIVASWDGTKMFGMIDVQWNPTSDLVASVYAGDYLVVWDPFTEQGVPLDTGNLGGIAVDWSPDGSYLVVSGAYGNTANIFDLASNQITSSLSGHLNAIGYVDWSPDDNRVTTNDGSNVYIWNATDGQLSFTVPVENVSQMRWNKDGQLLAMSDNDGKIVIWSVQTEKIIQTIQADSRIFEVAWNPLEDKLAYVDVSQPEDRLVILTISDPLMSPTLCPSQTAPSALDDKAKGRTIHPAF